MQKTSCDISTFDIENKYIYDENTPLCCMYVKIKPNFRQYTVYFIILYCKADELSTNTLNHKY